MIIKIFILGIRRDFRGSDLHDLLFNAGLNVEIVFGADAQLGLPFDYTKCQKKSHFYYGRELSPGEHACTYGHSLMIKKAFISECDLAVFLEDDVIITNVKKFIELIKTLDTTQKNLFTFYQNNKSFLNYGFVKGSKFPLRNYCIPISTVAYAITKPALRSIQKFENDSQWLGFQADFPLYYADDISFFIASHNTFVLHDSESLIGARGTHADLDNSRLARIIGTYSTYYWFRFGKFHSSLKAYVMFFHGRKIAKILFKLKNWKVLQLA